MLKRLVIVLWCLLLVAGCQTLAGQWPVIATEAEAAITTSAAGLIVGMLAFPYAVEAVDVLSYWLDRTRSYSGPTRANPHPAGEMLCAPSDPGCLSARAPAPRAK